MTSDVKARVTEIVAGLGGGCAAQASTEELLELVYDELRWLAERYMRGERPGHTLQPTALVHEAYLKLVDRSQVDWRGRSHFFAVSARVMRRILIDHARGRGRQKRGGGWRRITLTDAPTPEAERGLDRDRLLCLGEALEKLAALDERQARIVELRFFGGLTIAEMATHLGVSRRTVEGDWTYARAWLRRQLSRAAESDGPFE